MSDSHSAALLAKHATLDARISNESQRPRPDETLVHRLKKQKLKIKEALAKL
ncbi:YdcH family protein [Sphingomonas bacterium]|uniref:YdcH family protein n=1 Tax=Sphingomonas bacterium TaxID=1895847 RepID=UPI0015760663|nr:YdcH family protein [Sphingomonas bacterium]